MFKVIIVDDDKGSREVLQALLTKYFSDRVNVCAVCSSMAEGLDAVHQFHPDLVFLDIEMPSGSGFDFMEKLDKIDFQLVFVTAYSDYALKAIKFHALDYILKPVDPNELRKTITWAEERMRDRQPAYNGKDLLERFRQTIGIQNLGVPTNEGVIFVPIATIIRCEAASNYSVIHTQDGKTLTVSRTLRDLEDALSNHDFVRVHKSHLINLKMISHFYRREGIIQLQNNSNIPLGRQFKEEFEKRVLLI